jgi:hypothetical protein
MLVKWALEGKRKAAKTSVFGSDLHVHGAAPERPPSTTSRKINDQQQIFQLPVKSETTAEDPALTAELDRLHFQSDAALAKSSEDNEDRTMRRFQAEEMASSLRDDKLLSISGAPQIHRHHSYEDAGGPSMPLTQENMQKFAHEQDVEPALHRMFPEPGVSANASVGLDSNDQSESTHRPSLREARLRDSERTVTTASP